MSRTILCWSGGKDCAWALEVLRRSGNEVSALITTFNVQRDRVSMHDVRQELIEAQAASLGLPLWSVPIPFPCSNQQYEQAMAAVCQRAVAGGVEAVAFGDLHLADVRAYRERSLAGTGLQPVFPLWEMPTRELAGEMIAAGMEARIVTLDTRVMPRPFIGQVWNEQLISELPAGVDPCGENGEFHTFVSNGPMFSRPVAVKPGDIREEAGFLHIDLKSSGGGS